MPLQYFAYFMFFKVILIKPSIAEGLVDRSARFSDKTLVSQQV
jgi:hypothetical protein